MDAIFIAEMKDKLEEERAELRKRIGFSDSEDQNKNDEFHAKLPQYGDSEEDNASEVAQYQDDLSLEGNLQGRLAEVEKALDKMEEGNYGKCDHCGEEIPRERIAVNPAAAVCVKCSNI
jgi:RNA polymerase-binding transcription factor DksA